MIDALRISRRSLLGAVGGGTAAALLARSGTGEAASAPAEPPRKHLAYVWQFNHDGPPAEIRANLAQNGLGIILKTHDGMSWMGRWDRSAQAIRGPGDVRALANYFESAGVPFHAWCVPKGIDPIGEAQMGAEVVANGARSLVIDIEPPEGDQFWQGEDHDAFVYGQELRRLQPNAWLSICPDPRPWQVEALPIPELARFCNEIAPQIYWELYDNRGTHNLLAQRGISVGREGLTPELLLDVGQASLGGFGLPLRPIGEGSSDRGKWQRFVQHAYRLGMQNVQVWRWGTTSHDVWPLLHQMAPVQPPPPPPAAPVQKPPPPLTHAGSSYNLRSRAAFEPSSDRPSTPRLTESGLFGSKGVPLPARSGGAKR